MAKIIRLELYEEGIARKRALRLAEGQISDDLKEIGFKKFAGYYWRTFSSLKELNNIRKLIEKAGTTFSKAYKIDHYINKNVLGEGLIKGQKARLKHLVKASLSGLADMQNREPIEVTAARAKKRKKKKKKIVIVKNKLELVPTLLGNEPALAVSEHDPNSDVSKLVKKFGFTFQKAAWYMPIDRSNVVEFFYRLRHYGYKVKDVDQLADYLPQSFQTTEGKPNRVYTITQALRDGLRA